VAGATLIKFQHSAPGLIEDQQRENVAKGWGHLNANLRKRAETAAQGKKAAGR